MIQQEIVVVNPSGLHARPASLLATAAGRFRSQITIRFGGGAYNAKSVIKIMSACVKQGSTIALEVDGPDEREAMATLEELITSGLGEEIPG